jgi:hypothetical protein
MLCQGQAQENRGSANYMLPFCQTWLKVAVERDPEVVGSIFKTEEPIRLTHLQECALASWSALQRHCEWLNSRVRLIASY